MSSIELQTTPAVEQVNRYEHDRLLLQKFVVTRSEEAFAALFHRYHAFVYSVCMREIRRSRTGVGRRADRVYCANAQSLYDPAGNRSLRMALSGGATCRAGHGPKGAMSHGA